ncbi:MAG: hypothetical protein JST30_00170 [Armatimonadetes bacterium]|nr:hypothetical protein [Armatimonadota bacterium]
MNPSTEPFRRELTGPEEARPVAETQFEKPRGIHRVEMRRGYCTVHVTGLEQASDRVKVLGTISGAGISIDFLKLTPGGLSFLTQTDERSKVVEALDSQGAQYAVNDGRCIVLAHAANMRDEEGLIARVVSEVIGTGVVIDHLGDMHDRVLMVMDAGDGERVAERISSRLVEEEP